MNTFDKIGIGPGKAICYSGFRKGQRPGGVYPSKSQIIEDLDIICQHWDYIRLYDVDLHAERVLEVIQDQFLPLKVMLGAYVEAEVNNYHCPWGGGVYPDEVLAYNKKKNDKKVNMLIELCLQYPDIINIASVGNEACVGWTDHMVPVQRVVEWAQRVQTNCLQPVTFCENYVPWLEDLKPLAEVLDIISIHTYPVWEYKAINEGLVFTKENYQEVHKRYPDKPVIITEAGWTTKSNGRGIPPHHVNEAFQREYFNQLMEWVEEAGILTYYFEAFDESWKGSEDPLEPEKHWGLFHEDRSPKMAMKNIYSNI